MRKRRWLPIVCFCAGLALLGFAIASRSREPTCEGKDLSYWVSLWNDTQPDISTKRHAREAIVTLGTNNLDLLVSRISFEPERNTLVSLAWKLRPALGRRVVLALLGKHLVRKGALQHDAMVAFYAMGPLGVPAVPQLVKVVEGRGDKAALTALNALGAIGEPALPIIASISSNGTPQIRRAAVYRFRNYTNSPLARLALTNALQDPDPEVRRSAFRMLTGQEFE